MRLDIGHALFVRKHPHNDKTMRYIVRCDAVGTVAPSVKDVLRRTCGRLLHDGGRALRDCIFVARVFYGGPKALSLNLWHDDCML